MSSRWLPLLAVSAIAAAALVLALVFARSDSPAPLEVDRGGPAPRAPERAAAKVPPIGEPAAPAPAGEVKGGAPESAPVEPPRVEPPVARDGSGAVARGAGDPEVRRLAAELAALGQRVAALEASLLGAQQENARQKAEIEVLKAERDRLAAANAPFDPSKLPKRKEFEATGEVVDNLEVYKPTYDGYWTSLRLETWLHPEIRRYRIKWFSGKWSPWFTPGIDDEDSKTNEDGTKRRIWSYFTDHEFQVER